MADRSKIEWCDATLNPQRARNKQTGKVGWFCEHASPGYIHCYSEAFNVHRPGNGVEYKRQNRDAVELFLDENMLLRPLRWRRPRRIFWNSMSDTFGEFVPDEWIDRQFATMAMTPWHTHLVLTKRGDRLSEYLGNPASRRRIMAQAIDRVGPNDACHVQEAWPLPNVWAAVSVEDQRRADERCDYLYGLAMMGWRTWVSYEPAIGPVDWTGWELIDFMVSGGESGRHARPSHPDWHRNTRNWCVEQRIPYQFKQWGEWLPSDQESAGEHVARERRYLNVDGVECHGSLANIVVHRVGKVRAGRLLDGVEHLAMPGGGA